MRPNSGGVSQVGMDGVTYLVGYQRGAAPLFVLVDAARAGPGFAAGGRGGGGGGVGRGLERGKEAQCLIIRYSTSRSGSRCSTAC